MINYSRSHNNNPAGPLIVHGPFPTSGQGVSEYGLIMALLAIAAVSALTLLGNSLNLGFNTMVPAPSSRITSPTAGSQPDVSSHSSGTTLQSYAPWERPLHITLQNGSQITINGYPDNLSKAIMTVGANGTTTQLLATLERLIDELRSKSEITEAQASALRTLANRGHDMAEREKFIEDYLSNSQNSRPQAGEAVTYKGKTYSGLDEFSRSLDILSSGLKKESQAAFDEAYQEALNSAALQDPAVRAVVDSLVQDIVNIADVFGGETSAFLTRPEKYPTYQDLLESTASKQTHQDSAEICKVGDRKDSGIQCL
jgi:Flp pilus assembly pilin Flp